MKSRETLPQFVRQPLDLVKGLRRAIRLKQEQVYGSESERHEAYEKLTAHLLGIYELYPDHIATMDRPALTYKSKPVGGHQGSKYQEMVSNNVPGFLQVKIFRFPNGQFRIVGDKCPTGMNANPVVHEYERITIGPTNGTYRTVHDVARYPTIAGETADFPNHKTRSTKVRQLSSSEALTWVDRIPLNFEPTKHDLDFALPEAHFEGIGGPIWQYGTDHLTSRDLSSPMGLS